MAEVSLFIATSLDGFIADSEGGVDWLFTDQDYGYAAFFATVGALVMGRRTYEQVLGFGDWPYGATPAIVLTRNPADAADVPSVSFASGQPDDILQGITVAEAKKIWLVGGSEVATAFARAGLIDEVVLSIHPTLLGDGVPLFTGRRPRQDFALADCRSYETGLVQLTSRRKAGGLPGKDQS